MTKLRLLSIAFALTLMAAPPASASLDLSDKPLFVSATVPPNVMFIIDDSGSMQWSYIPDDIEGACQLNSATTSWNYRAGRSAAYNPSYFNPELTYAPPFRADGSQFPDADFNAAWRDGYNQAQGQINLGGNDSYRATWRWPWNSGNNCRFGGETGNRCWCGGSGLADYHNFTCDYDEDVQPWNQAIFEDASCYERVIVRDQSAEEQQNFANWFSYYRTRQNAARAGIGAAFAEVPEQLRVGWGRIWQTAKTNVDGSEQAAVVQGVRSFGGSHKEDFYDWLYTLPAPGATPLRVALEGAGTYFENTTDRGPYSTTPGQQGGELLGCRLNFSVLMTDGYYNDSTNQFSITEADSVEGEEIVSADGSETYQYQPVAPFARTQQNTLADIAMHYWKNDLTDLPNNVPTSDDNPAFWQHMITYGVGLGVFGSVDPDEAFAAIETNTAIDWAPINTDPGKIDDLLHAAVNSRGGFFSATEPEQFAAELASTLRSIVARGLAQANETFSGAAASADGGLQFATELNSQNWSGDVIRQVIGQDADIRASENFPAPGDRNIVTFDRDSNQVVAFSAVGLPNSLRTRIEANTALDADTVIDYVRGVNIDGLRSRTNLLGTVVNSQPVLFRKETFGWEQSGYNAEMEDQYFDYVDEKGDKRAMVFVGSNAGMLHAFDAQTMRERFAFVPSEVLERLHLLTDDEEYDHEYFVDGQLTVRDVFNSQEERWQTILLGTLGAGGRSVFALDITDPTNPSLMWERTAEDIPELGYTFARATAVRIDDGSDYGRWRVALGNGYKSKDDRAHLVLIDVFDPSKVDTIAAGSAGNATNPNGLSSVRAGFTRPLGSDRFHRWVWAGDLHGQLWRFDIKDLEATAIHNLGRPITAAPQVATNPGRESDGFYVGVGSGKLIENDDPTTKDPEFFVFGIDRPAQTSGQGAGSLEVLWDRTLEDGERVLFQPRVIADRVFFNTYKPLDDPCTPGGENYLYGVRAYSGEGSIGLPNSQFAGQESLLIDIGAPAPVEVIIARGSADGMSGAVGSGSDIIVSNITIGSLEDLRRLPGEGGDLDDDASAPGNPARRANWRQIY